MSRAAFIEKVAKKGKMSKAEAKRTVDLVLGEVEAGLKKSKREGRYTIGNFGTFTIAKRKARRAAIRRPARRSGSGPPRSALPPLGHTAAGRRRQVIHAPSRSWGGRP